MSDPIVKGAKRNTSRPAPQSASTKSSAKGKAATAAKPKPQRAAAEKPPVRKAAPARPSRTAAKASAKPAAEKAKSAAAAKKSAAKPKTAPAKTAKTTAATGRSAKPKAAAKPQPKKAATRPQPAKATAAKSQPAKPASKPHAHQTARPSARQAATGKATAKAAPRPAPPPPRRPSRDEAAALKAFERAHKEFTRGRFETARDLFRTLITQHAGVSEVAARARTYLNIAESRLRQEAALPRDADALYDRGVFEMNRGDFVAAQEMFERALKRDASVADTHYALAAARSRLGAVETAIESLDQAINLNPRLRLRAQNDLDFVALRNEPDFERIVFAGTRA